MLNNKLKLEEKQTSAVRLVAFFATLVLLIAESMPVAIARSKTNEFTLDELTRADRSYQPINFGSFHSSPPYAPAAATAKPSALQSPVDADGLPSRASRLQLIEQALGGESGRQSIIQTATNMKRAAERAKTCHPTKPFLCPSDEPQGGECIPIQYLCDGSSDCPAYAGSTGGYDEDPLLCTAAKRPPVEETANFLRTLLTNHGPHYIEKLFGSKISQALEPLGGPERVAIALSVSKTIEDFGKALHLMRGDIDHLRNVLLAIQTTDGPMLKSLGIVRNSELADMKFFLEKLFSTGFLD